MSAIGGDGGIRRALESGRELPAQALARATELARGLAAMLDERNARGPQETARLLVEVPRLPPQAQEAFLTTAAGPPPDPSKPVLRELAETVRERIALAYPEGSDRRQKLGAALVSMEGGEPGALAASALEAKAGRAIAKLAGLSSASSFASAASSLSADTMERPRGFGPFGAPPTPPTGTSPSAMAPASGTSVFSVAGLITVQAGSTPAGSILQDEVSRALGGVPEAWGPIVARAQEIAPGLTNGLVPLGRAESFVTVVRQGLVEMGKSQGVWARARMAASVDAIDRVAARFESLRERLGGGLAVAAPPSAVARAATLADAVRGLRGETALARQDLAWARELVPGVALPQVGTAREVLAGAERDMAAADYTLQAFATQQDIVAGQAPGVDVPSDRGEAEPTLTPDMITPEPLAQLQGAGPGRITQEELDRVGTGITEAPPPQGFWNIGTVGVGMEPAFSCDSYSQAAAEAVNAVIGDSTTVQPLEGAELAAAIRDMGVPLEKVDPNQLQAALSFINTGASGAVAEFGRGAPQTVDEQRQRLTVALRQFRCLAEHGPAQMDRKTAIEVMWSAARIPGHAFEGMSDAEVLAMAQQTAAAVNTPGTHEYKVGRHTVKLTIGGNGSVQSTSTRPPSFWGTVGRIAKGALTVASFIPGPVGLVARGVQAGIALVNTVRHGGGLLNLVAAGASFVGAGAAAVGRLARTVPTVARVAGTVARVANAVSGVARGVQGIQRGGLGGVLSGAAGVANGFAGAIEGAGAAPGSSLGNFASGLSEVGRALDRVGAGVGAAEAYIHANRAVGAAREALEQARASGDIAWIRQAEQQLAEAERGKRSAVLGGLAAAGQIAGDTLSRNSAGQPDPRTAQVPAQGRSAFQVGAEIFSRGMSTARGLNEGDVVTAGVEALGGLAAARQGTEPIQFRTTDDFSFLNQASSVLDGMNDWRGAEQGERQAREAVEQAEQALGLARASGDPNAIEEAEESLRQARRGLVQAELSSTLALDNAAERFTGAVVQRNELGRMEVLRTRAGDRAAQLAAVLDDPRASPGDRAAALEQFAQLSLAAREYEQAVASGDGERMRAARLALEQTQADLGPLPGLVRVAAVVVQDRDGGQRAQTDASTTTSTGRREVEDIDRRLPWLADYGKPPAEAAPPTGTWYEELLLWRREQQGRFVQWLASLGRSAGEGALAERTPTEQTITRQQLAAALADDPALADALRQEAERYAPAGSLRETAGDVGQAGGGVAGQIAWDSAEGKALATLFSGVLIAAAAGRLGSLPSSRTLGRNLETAGFVRPPGAAAHHIVASGAKRAEEAQAILSRFGIDINDAANGVFLPRNRSVLTPPRGAVHSSLHSIAYYRQVELLLGQATNREKAIEILALIRQRLLDGRFP